MHNARFRVMAGLAGATLCLFAATAYGQNPTTQTTTGAAGTGAQTAQPTTPAPTTATSGGAAGLRLTAATSSWLIADWSRRGS
jgi:hypothetical protein